MPKDIPVSNGSFLLNFDSNYRLRDIFFPYIGQENHTKGHPSRFGVWVDGQISWIGPEWEKDIRYWDDSQVTNVLLKNERLGLELECHDMVDFEKDVYIKEIQVHNLTDKKKDVRLFFTHDFHLYGNEIGDTIYYDPEFRSLIQYKSHRYFLINCHVNGKVGVDHFTCGRKEVANRQGTWEDAEDGELNGNPVAWGSADSTVGIYLDVPAGGKSTGHYWIAAGTTRKEVGELNQHVLKIHPNKMIKRTTDYWGVWVKKEPRTFADLPDSITDLFHRSLLILRTQIDNRGAIIAANDTDIIGFGGDTYSYMWGRDGAFVAAAMAKSGYAEMSQRFFRFCASILSEQGYMFQHYYPDGAVASNWHAWFQEGKEILPIQEDSTALVLWAIWEHYESAKDIEFVKELYSSLIVKSADFLVSHRDPETLLPLPSYDLWEERWGVHTFTVSAVIAGLKAATNFANTFHDDDRAINYGKAAAEIQKSLIKYLYHPKLKRFARSGYRTKSGYDLDEVPDISLAGLVSLDVLDAKDPKAVQTMEAMRKELWNQTSVGGCARYRGDQYQLVTSPSKDIVGNPWFISTLWLGEYHIRKAENIDQLHEAMPYLEWCAKNALPSGVLAEQIHPIKASPLSVSPLTWSHSAFVWAVRQYVEKFDSLNKSQV